MAYAATFRPFADVFDPLPLEGKVEVIAQRLGDGIALGRIASPAPLPSTLSMARKFGVPTVIVQEALELLARDGVIEQVSAPVETPEPGPSGAAGAPTWATKVPQGRWAAADARLNRMGTHELRDLVDTYCAINAKTTALCAARATPDQVESLREIADVSAQFTTPLTAELEFHERLAITSQSSRLARLEVAHQNEIALLLGEPPPGSPWEPVATEEHLAIVELIEAGDEAGAARASDQHMAQIFGQLMWRHNHLRTRGPLP